MTKAKTTTKPTAAVKPPKPPKLKPGQFVLAPGLPPVDLALAKEPFGDDAMERLWGIMLRANANYQSYEEREQHRLDRMAEAERQLELLAVELDYNKAFWRKFGRYPEKRGEFYYDQVPDRDGKIEPVAVERRRR